MWSSLAHLSWMGKIVSPKMVLLPKILYYICTLPVVIPAADPHTIYATQRRLRQVGSSGPYYRAARLIQLSQLYSKFYIPECIVLEAQVCVSLPIDLLKWILPNICQTVLSPTLSHSHPLWISSSKLAILQSLHTPVALSFDNPAFLPGFLSPNFQWWLKKRLLSHRTLP